jgi:hypothetical protein
MAEHPLPLGLAAMKKPANMRAILSSVCRCSRRARSIFDCTFRFGRGEKIRTSDPLHPMQVRYQAALRPDTKGAIITEFERHGNLEACSGSAQKIQQRLQL